MKRFWTIAIVAMVGLVASCQKAETGKTVEVATAAMDAPDPPPANGHITVHTTCPVADEDAGGATIQPWAVHVSKSAAEEGKDTVTWNVPSDVMASIEYVDPSRWPFGQAHYPPQMGGLKARVNAKTVRVREKYRYRLTITCPAPGNHVIVIDPIVIIDP